MNALLSAIRQHSQTKPDATALDPVGGEALHYGDIVGRIEARSRELERQFSREQAVVLQDDYGVEPAIDELALLLSGIPVLSLPRFFTEAQTRHAIEQCHAVSKEPSEETRGKCLRGAPEPSRLPRGTARVTFTSGSTGTPKGVCLSAEHMIAVAQAVVDRVGAHNAGRHCAILPPGILLEWVAGFLATLLAGGTYVCPTQSAVGMTDPFFPDYAKMVGFLAEQRITSLILVPEYLGGLVKALRTGSQRLPDLTLVAVGGARVPVELLAEARALGLPVRQGYGLTECGSVVSLEDEDGDRIGSAGRLLGPVQATIADDGEIVLEGALCLGTVGAPRAPGPLHTGDLGRIDAQGRLWIEGRKSALIVTSFGRNVSPEWVETALGLQPDIMQACVHGNGLAAPEALLVPSRPDADLAAAVASANATLPPYAQVARWREVAPFTPANGMLTGNGRLRRQAIAERWIEREPAFFDRLEADTVRQRLAFLAVPQVRAGLAGAIDRWSYLDYLEQAYHHVSHTVPLMQAARARLGDRPRLIAALDDYIAEETGHEHWILEDIAAAGGNPAAVRNSRPNAATQSMVERAYKTIREGNPAAFFGMVYVLESVSVALAQRGATALATNLGLPPAAFTYLTSHGALDQDHMAFFANLVNGIEEEDDRQAITAMAREIFGLFGGIFASIAMERPVVAA